MWLEQQVRRSKRTLQGMPRQGPRQCGRKCQNRRPKRMLPGTPKLNAEEDVATESQGQWPRDVA